MFLKLCLPQVLLFVSFIKCTSVAIQFRISYRSGYFASLSRVCTNLSQVVFARSLYRHFYRKFTIHQYFCMQHHSFTFSLLKQGATWAVMGRKSGNYLNEGLNRGKIFEKHGQPNRRLSLQPLSVPPKLFAKFVTFSLGSSCNFAEINNLCAARNNDDGVKHSFSICSALGCFSFEPVLTL